MNWEEISALAGRLLLAAIFLAAAFGKITNFQPTAAYIGSHGLPWPSFFCAAAAAVETLGGLCLVLGLYARQGSAVLALFLLAATVIFHAGAGAEQRIHLLKNIAIVGGLLQVAAWGPGALSLEGRGRR